MQMQNINNFILSCQKLGVPKTDTFVTVDLYEGKNIPKVVDCLFSLGAVLQDNKDWKGPTIGEKRSEKKRISIF